MRPIRILTVIGTRPEAIKLVPVILAARARPREFEVRIVRTGQHRGLVDELSMEFGLDADADLKVMQPNQEPAYVLSASVRGLSDLIVRDHPDWVIVQGDTTTTLAGALAAFYSRARIGHVEAGLRTGNRRSPFPEEINRLLTTHLADLHFAPTEGARRNLLREGIDSKAIVVTGNTVVDALLRTRDLASFAQTLAQACRARRTSSSRRIGARTTAMPSCASATQCARFSNVILRRSRGSRCTRTRGCATC